MRLTLMAWSLMALAVCVSTSADPDVAAQPLAQAGLCAAFGGATSNALDRLTRGAVIDFIAVGFWPVFNPADVAIVGGLGVAVLALL